jgi:hypothetical protein
VSSEDIERRREQIVAMYVTRGMLGIREHFDKTGWAGVIPVGDIERFRPAIDREARRFADAFILARYNRDDVHKSPSLDDECLMAVELLFLVGDHVGDPHDWDEVGTVVDLIEYIWRNQ